MEQKLSIPLLKFIYYHVRKPTKRKEVLCYYEGKMNEKEFIRCMEIVNSIKK